MTDRPFGVPPFQIGDLVYVPWAISYAQKEVRCPICVGRRSVVLILGSGEHVPVECQGCDRGYEGAQGVVMIHVPDSGIREAEVTGLAISDDGWHVTVGGFGSEKASDVFPDRSSAEARRVEMHAEAEAQAARNFESQFKEKRKKHGWTVHYHRAEIAKLERSLAWHRSKLTCAQGVSA